MNSQAELISKGYHSLVRGLIYIFSGLISIFIDSMGPFK